MKNRLSLCIRIVVSFGLLGGLFWVMRNDLRDVWGIVRTSDPLYTTAAAALLVIMVWTLSLRLKTVFRGEDLSLSLGEAFQLTCVGYFFNNFMPTAVGGDIIKAHYAACFNKKKMRSYASVLMDRFIGMFTILLLAAIALFLEGRRFDVPLVKPLVVVFMGLGVALSIMVTNSHVARFLARVFTKFRMMGLGEKLNEMYGIAHDYRNRSGVVIRSVLLSICAQISYYSLIYFLFISMGRPVNMSSIFMIMPVVIFISILPSIGGLGVREAAIVTFFSVSAGREVAFAVSLLALCGYFIISLAGGAVYIGWGFRLPLERKPGCA